MTSEVEPFDTRFQILRRIWLSICLLRHLPVPPANLSIRLFQRYLCPKAYKRPHLWRISLISRAHTLNSLKTYTGIFEWPQQRRSRIEEIFWGFWFRDRRWEGEDQRFTCCHFCAKAAPADAHEWKKELGAYRTVLWLPQQRPPDLPKQTPFANERSRC